MPEPKRVEDAKDSLLCLLQHTKLAIQELNSLEQSALVALRGIGENKLDTARFHRAIDNIKKTGKLGSETWHVATRSRNDFEVQEISRGQFEKLKQLLE